MRRNVRRIIASATVLVLSATPALAGPPLLCHPYETGNARSLPWDGSRGWLGEAQDYRLDGLIADTEALLTPSTPVIARMETLRRASLYASRDRATASQLLARLLARVSKADASGTPDAMALLDAAYVAGAFHEMSRMGAEGQFRARSAVTREALGNTDAYALIQRSISVRPDDAAIHFAAALIASSRDRDAYLQHARKAREGAAKDALLARNISHVS